MKKVNKVFEIHPIINYIVSNEKAYFPSLIKKWIIKTYKKSYVNLNKKNYLINNVFIDYVL